jgi:hypothetical protein
MAGLNVRRAKVGPVCRSRCKGQGFPRRPHGGDGPRPSDLKGARMAASSLSRQAAPAASTTREGGAGHSPPFSTGISADALEILAQPRPSGVLESAPRLARGQARRLRRAGRHDGRLKETNACWQRCRVGNRVGRLRRSEPKPSATQNHIRCVTIIVDR